MTKREKFTFLPDPEGTVRSLEAARMLRAQGLAASGAFLTAAEHLIAQGIEVTQDTLADALHEQE